LTIRADQMSEDLSQLMNDIVERSLLKFWWIC